MPQMQEVLSEIQKLNAGITELISIGLDVLRRFDETQDIAARHSMSAEEYECHQRLRMAAESGSIFALSISD